MFQDKDVAEADKEVSVEMTLDDDKVNGVENGNGSCVLIWL